MVGTVLVAACWLHPGIDRGAMVGLPHRLPRARWAGRLRRYHAAAALVLNVPYEKDLRAQNCE